MSGIKVTKIADKIREEYEIENNKIILVTSKGETYINKIPNTEINFLGNNSLIKIYEGFNIKKLVLNVGENSYVEFGKNFRVRFSLYIDARAKNTTVILGNDVNIGKGEIYAGDDDNLEVIIGDEFLSAIGLYIRTSDGHTVYDIETNEIINKSEFGVHIGNHVWCGYNVTLLKDSIIPNNCVIGANSVVVNNNYEENSIIAGYPAKIIKTGVNWSAKTITDFSAEKVR